MFEESKKRLYEAVRYAIQSDYAVYNKQKRACDKLAAAKDVCIFGAGRFFREGYPYVKALIQAKYLCDNHIDGVIAEKRNTYGLECLHVDELEQKEGILVVIMLGKGYCEVKNQLDQKRIDNMYVGELLLNMYTPRHNAAWFSAQRDDIMAAADLFEDDRSRENYVEIICNRIAPHLSKKTFEEIKTEGEYFDTGVFQYLKEEIFVDIGAYTGDTIEQFCSHCQKEKIVCKQIYAYEMDAETFEQLQENVAKIKDCNIEIHQKGIAQKDDEANSMLCLDRALEGKQITLIKMDIEGYEWGALHGGRMIIQKWKPKMAVCLYHCLEDLWRIPIYIKQLNPEYKLYLRHHSPVVWDSVLYAG